MKYLLLFTIAIITLLACKKDKAIFEPTPYEPEVPGHFPKMIIPADNPMTVEGVELGRKLFYDARLSLDNSISCSSCHDQQYAFSDPKQFSLGVGDSVGTRNSMALVNLGWQQFFFWDGRAKTLEDQILGPVPNPIEMHLEWPQAVKKIAESQDYRNDFFRAFGAREITKELVAKAIAQFLRTLISGTSKYDVIYKHENGFTLTSKEQAIWEQVTNEEKAGFDLFKSLNGADCFHCHNGALMQVQKYSNNGLDAVPSDPGREAISGSSADRGKFKVPTLRNIALTAPYMHDGRFATLDEVIEHYSSGVHQSATIDPLIEYAFQGGVQLSDDEKQLLKAFLLTMTDYEFISNPKFAKP